MHVKFTKNGITKEVKVGFSWTTLFFGAWVPLLRGMWVQLLIFIITLGFAQLYYIFTINKVYAYHLAQAGWKVHPADTQVALSAWNINQ